MRDPQTAHDAVTDVLCRDVPYLGPLAHEARAAAVLAALGIPADATVDDVRAGLAALAVVRDHGYPLEIEADTGRYLAWADRAWAAAASPAAAVLALHNKLTRRADG